jgi:hypothetical protein
MVSTYPSSREQEHPHGGRPHKECPECDLGALDDLMCDAEGIKAQSDYTTSKKAEQDARRTQFDGARASYNKARADASDDVKEIRHQLTRILDHLRRCLPEDVLRCLDRAWDKVKEELEDCGMPKGCCLDDDEECEFDTSHENVPTQDLLARKAEFERRVKAAEDCFAELIKEPEELKKRVAELKAAVEALSKDTANDKESYAKALWYWRRLEDIWLGFEHANEYHDCLCQALMCSVKGHTAIAVLVGEIARRACRDRGEKARCDWLRTHVVDQILAHCQRHHPREYEEDEDQTKQANA